MEQDLDAQESEENSRPDTTMGKLKELLLSSYTKFVAGKALFYLVVVFFSSR